jgi:hypothetical protein
MSTRERPGTVADELHVALEARRELSPEHEPELVEAFLDRVGAAIDRRVDERLAERLEEEGGDDGEAGVWLAIGSFAVGIPLTAVAGSVGLAGIIAVWTGIVLVNLAYWRR